MTVLEITVDTTWRTRTACLGLDPAIFYPEPGDNKALALAICEACPVRASCLQHALDTREPEGIWGGKTDRQRKRMLTAIAPRFRAPRTYRLTCNRCTRPFTSTSGNRKSCPDCISPEESEARRRAQVKNNHYRSHTSRGVVVDDCPHCKPVASTRSAV